MGYLSFTVLLILLPFVVPIAGFALVRRWFGRRLAWWYAGTTATAVVLDTVRGQIIVQADRARQASTAAALDPFFSCVENVGLGFVMLTAWLCALWAWRWVSRRQVR